MATTILIPQFRAEIAALLRRVFGNDAAKQVAGAADASHRTTERWVRGETSPAVEQYFLMCLNNADMSRATRALLDRLDEERAAVHARLDQLEQERARRVVGLARVRLDRPQPVGAGASGGLPQAVRGARPALMRGVR